MFKDDPPGKPGGLTALQKGSLWRRESALSPDGIDPIRWAKLVDQTMPEEYWAKKKKADEEYWKSPEGKKFAEEMRKESSPEELAKTNKRFTEYAKELEESGGSPFAGLQDLPPLFGKKKKVKKKRKSSLPIGGWRSFKSPYSKPRSK